MTRGELDEAYAMIAGEIGDDPESRLKWLLEVLQTPFAQIPDWRKLRIALAAFSSCDPTGLKDRKLGGSKDTKTS